ncbi:MAG: bifunctional (p)ppGpp synthetase/guanosine-3',5'-bis(diphosphate) 3'-pyrophosphohydrolase [Lactobacillales bacterium]|jgi:GTP pyrophosphokinase|nr:bifunctional (p)ppGpp synthetase/guanosine-3',5'-bis(diphosphate) 3'-pyrophosphohydrolase [Lactobacillales bacterium]
MAKEKEFTHAEVLEIAESYMDDASLALVKKAWQVANEAHKDQQRKSGEPYIIHPIQVAGILANLHLDAETVAAAFLHDVIEDTEWTKAQIAAEFSENVADLVDGVTKLGKIKYASHEEQLAENHRKMLMAMARDVRVILIKLADRLHNIRTLGALREDKQKRIAKETLEIYAPLAHRLGISLIKWELEDTSFRYVNPQQFYRIVALMDSKLDERRALIDDTVAEIKRATEDIVENSEIYGRPKHIYSIYRKMRDKKKEFDEIYDLLAIRIVVKTTQDCYAVLGAIHTELTPMPGRFKDYIAMPKSNGYQSLHTTVIGPNGSPIEIQIRTREMHETAEFGVAAHWAYKKGVEVKPDEATKKQVSWLKDIEELQLESTTASEFVEGVKGDLFEEKVYVFTPRGEVTELPNGAGPLDFAYSVHTQVGNSAVGAKVNGKMVTLDYVLHTGDIIEILTASAATPRMDWLKLVKTRRAKNKIKSHFRNLEREENITKGREAVIAQLESMDFKPADFLTKEKVEEVVARYHVKSSDDLLSMVGFGEISALSLANRLSERERMQREQEKRAEQLNEMMTAKTEIKPEAKSSSGSNGIIIEGINSMMWRMSRCCNPVYGDDIVGYITKGRGVSIHRADCVNVLNADDDLKNRLVDVEWGGAKPQAFNAVLEVHCFDRDGILNEILIIVSGMTKKLLSVEAKSSNKGNVGTIRLELGINDIAHLEKIIDRIKSVPDVYEVVRANG